MCLTSYSLVKACSGDLVHQSVADEDRDDQNQVDAAGEGIQAHLIEVIECGREDEALHTQQHEQRQLAQAGHERKQEARNDRGLLDRDDDPRHTLDPGDILDDGSLFDLAGELQHGVERASAGKRDIFDRAHDDQQRVGVEEVELLGGEQDEKRDADGDGRHEVGQERDGVYIVCPAAAAVFGDGVADHRADCAGEQCAGDGDEDRSLERAPDGLVIQDALLAVHAVFGDIFAGEPPLGREVRSVSRIEERIVARVREEGLKRKRDDGEDACEEREDDKNDGDDVLADTYNNNASEYEKQADNWKMPEEL